MTKQTLKAMEQNETKQTPKDKRKAKMLEALEASAGIVSTASAACGVSRKTHYNWLNDDQEYKAAVEELENIIVDKAESGLLQAIEAGDITAIIFTLKTKGKKRGYSEKIDFDAIAKEAEARILKAESAIDGEKRFNWRF